MSISVQCIDDSDNRDYARDAGRHCGALLPTGNPRDLVDGLWVTCIDGGVPLVLLCASTLATQGLAVWPSQPRQAVCGPDLVTRLGRIRLQAGYLMNLGDVSARGVPGLVVVNQPDGNVPCSAYRLARGEAEPLTRVEGASVTLAAGTTDTIVHETWPVEPPAILTLHTLGQSLRYQSSI